MKLQIKGNEELIEQLRANLQSAIAKATPLATETGVLRGERWIVIDKHERALTQYSEAGVSKIKLQLPPDDLNGVSFFARGGADQYVAHLQKDQPNFGPFVAWDFKDWQLAQIAKHQTLLQEISTPVNTPRASRDDGPSI
jgi:hypothetical protein